MIKLFVSCLAHTGLFSFTHVLYGKSRYRDYHSKTLTLLSLTHLLLKNEIKRLFFKNEDSDQFIFLWVNQRIICEKYFFKALQTKHRVEFFKFYFGMSEMCQNPLSETGSMFLLTH